MVHEERVTLVGAHEIRVLLGGITRQRVYQLTSSEGFPAPVAELGQGRCWSAVEVQEWIERYRGRVPLAEGSSGDGVVSPRRVAGVASRRKRAEKPATPDDA